MKMLHSMGLAKALAFVLAMGLTSCSNAVDADKVTPERAAAWIAEDPQVQVLDVRTLSEYRDGHLSGAVLVPWGEADFGKRVLMSIDPKKPVLVYCRSGRRSSAAIEVLSKLGFAQLKNLDGGIMAWQNAGKPVISDE